MFIQGQAAKVCRTHGCLWRQKVMHTLAKVNSGVSGGVRPFAFSAMETALDCSERGFHIAVMEKIIHQKICFTC